MMIKFLQPALLATALVLSAAPIAPAQTTADRSDDVHWVLELGVKDGRGAEVAALEAEMSPATEQEDGAVAYEWYRDGDTVHLFERFADSEGALTHLANFEANFAERFLDLFEITGWTLYGPASDELRAKVEPMGGRFYERIGGFAR